MKLLFKMLVLGVVICGCSAVWAGKKETAPKLPYLTFVEYVKQGKVKSIVLYKYRGIDAVVQEGKQTKKFAVDKPYSDTDDPIFMNFLNKHKVTVSVQEKQNSSLWSMTSPLVGFFTLLFWAVPILILLFVFTAFYKIRRIESMLEKLTDKLDNNS